MAAKNSKFHGVSWNGSTNKWQARIVFRGKRISLGYFASEKHAALAYDYAIGYRTSSAREQNLPDEPIPESVIRVVRPKLKTTVMNTKVEDEASIIDDKFWVAGSESGVLWAINRESIKIKDSVDPMDPYAVCGALGALDELAAAIDKYKLKTKAKRYCWMKGFLFAARNVWSHRTDSEPNSAQDAPNSVPGGRESQMTSQLASQPTDDDDDLDESSAQHHRQKTDEEIAATISEPIRTSADLSQVIYSENCNPETLARDNAAIRAAADANLGIFGMIKRQRELMATGLTAAEADLLMARERREADESAGPDSSLAEIDGLLAGIL